MRRDPTTKKEQVVVSPQAQEFNKTTADLNDLILRVGAKRKELTETSDEYIAVSNKLETTIKKMKEAQSLLDKVLADIQSQEATKQPIIDDINNLPARKAHADNEYAEYKKSLLLKQEAFKDELEKEKAELSANKRKFESEVTDLKISIEYYTKTVQSLSDQVDAQHKENEELWDKGEKIKKENEALEKIGKDLSDQKGTLTKEVTDLIENKQALLKAKELAEEDVAAFRDVANELSKEISEKKSTMGRLFIKEEKLKELTYMLKDFYNKNGIPIPNELNF
jgi:chromosome segregation ATPase